MQSWRKVAADGEIQLEVVGRKMVAEIRAKPAKKTVKFRSQKPYVKMVTECHGEQLNAAALNFDKPQPSSNA